MLCSNPMQPLFPALCGRVWACLCSKGMLIRVPGKILLEGSGSPPPCQSILRVPCPHWFLALGALGASKEQSSCLWCAGQGRGRTLWHHMSTAAALLKSGRLPGLTPNSFSASFIFLDSFTPAPDAAFRSSAVRYLWSPPPQNLLSHSTYYCETCCMH